MMLTVNMTSQPPSRTKVTNLDSHCTANIGASGVVSRKTAVLEFELMSISMLNPKEGSFVEIGVAIHG